MSDLRSIWICAAFVHVCLMQLLVFVVCKRIYVNVHFGDNSYACACMWLTMHVHVLEFFPVYMHMPYRKPIAMHITIMSAPV